MITKIFTIKWINKVLKNHDNINWQTIDNILSNNQYLDNYLPSVYNKIKGDLFEIITKYMLLQEYKICYLYQEIPNQLKQLLNLPNQDRGIDLICSNDNINFIGIQCKWRTNINQSIKKCLVTEFLHEINNSKLKYGIMVTNVKRITPTFNKIQNLKWILNNTLNQKINKDTLNNILNSLSTIIKPPIKEIKNIELRSYQQEAVNNLLTNQDKNKKCIMACGTGKTIVMLEYINKKGLNNKKILFLFPSLHLINQIYKNFINKFNNKNILCICSQMDKLTLTQNEANEERAEELLNNFLALDTEKKFTTDINIIKERLKQNEIIVFCTYQSSELLKDQIFDIGIYDEAHKTVNNKSFGFTLNDTNCKIKERIYFTATPKYFKGPEDKCISMNNVQVYGNEAYNYTFKKAIEEKYILDFKIIGYVVNKDIADIIEEKYIKKDDINVPRDVIVSAIMLAEHIKKNDNCKKILTYHNTVNNALEYKKILDYVLNIYKINASIFTMSGNTNITHREEIINEFSKAKIGIICSARVLNEGIDIPCVDTVLFVETRKSTIDVTQCVGRAMRLYPGNEYCNIIIPIHYDKLLEEHNFSSIINILTAMKEIDDKIIEYFVGRKEGNNIVVKNMEYCEVIEDKLPVNYDVDDVIGKMGVKILDNRLLSWDMRKELLFEYVNINNKIPTPKIIYKNCNIGSWIHDQKKHINDNQNIRYKILSENDLIKQNLDKYLQYYELNKDKQKLSFDESLKLLLEYVEENNILPKNNTIYKGKNISNWLNQQKYLIQNKDDYIYKKLSVNLLIKQNIDIYLKNCETIKKKIPFNEMAKILFEYCEKTGKIPSVRTQYNNINIGAWLNAKKHKLNKSTDKTYITLSKNELIKKNLDEYLIKKKNINKEDKKTFDDSLKILFDYCDENGIVPIRDTIYKNYNIGSWFRSQKSYLNSNEDKKYIKLSMNKLVKDNIDKYIENKQENKEKHFVSFEESLQLLFEYCDINNITPKQNVIYKNIPIGKWYQYNKHLVKNKKNNEIYMKLSSNKLIKENLDIFLNKEKSYEDKISFKKYLNLVFEYCDIHNKIPEKNTIYKNKTIGLWLYNKRNNINNEDIMYIKLSKNKLIKQYLDEYLKLNIKKNNKSRNNFNESLKLLFEYCDINKKVPSWKTIYKDYGIGPWYLQHKIKIKNNQDKIYKVMSENIIVKQNLDEFLITRELNKDKIKLSFDESLKLFFEYINENNLVPTNKTIYKGKDIVNWFRHQKEKINDDKHEIYIKLSVNELVKQHLDMYLKNKKKL